MSAGYPLNKSFFLVSIFFLCLYLLPATSSAQSILETFEADLTLRTAPQRPSPGDTVRFTVQSALFDLPTSNISWYVNDELVLEGVGVSGVDVIAGPLGSETLVRVEVRKEGAAATASGAIRPTEVDLLWEGVTYVPPFYQGRALPSAGSNIRLFAVPRFQVPGTNSFVSPNELFYTWRKNNKIIQSASGKGWHSVVMEGPVLFGSDTISVEVRTADNMLVGGASTRITSVEPSLVLYEEHPIQGTLYHKAIQGDATLPEVEATFSAVPYFAPAQNPNSSLLLYNWRVNNVPVKNNPSQPGTITLNATGSSGRALLELTLTHATNFFLRVAKSWSMQLSNSGGSSASDPFQTQNQ